MTVYSDTPEGLSWRDEKSDMNEHIKDLEAKLAVATEALRRIADNCHTRDDMTYCSMAEEALGKIGGT